MAESSSQAGSCNNHKQRKAALLELPSNLKNLHPGDSPEFDAETIIETIELLTSIWEMYNQSVPEAYHHSDNPHFHALLDKCNGEQLDSPVRVWYKKELDKCAYQGFYEPEDWNDQSEWWKNYQFFRLLVCAAYRKLSGMHLTNETARYVEARTAGFAFDDMELLLSSGLELLMEIV